MVWEILKDSPYAKVWRSEFSQFDRLLAFDVDSVVVVERYVTDGARRMRFRQTISRDAFAQKQLQLDTLVNVSSRQGAPLTADELEELRTTFTYDQTGYSAFHGFTIATLLEEGSLFLIVTGGSYFLISSIADDLRLTRANVEAARYGHLTGIFQGYALGLTIWGGDDSDTESSVKGVVGLSSAGGIANAISSYSMMNKTGINPTTQYLRLVAERHSLVWGAGLSLMVSGEKAKTQSVMGAACATSLSSLLWSEPLFGLSKRRMSWGDALLADEFMTPWYLTLAAGLATAEVERTSGAGAVVFAGGVGGYLLGMAVNEGGMRDLSTVRRTRLLSYGGSLLGLGIAAAAKPSGKATLWIIAASSWLGYWVGMQSGGGTSTSSWDLQITPEGLLLGSLDRTSPIPRSAPVASLSVRL